MYLSIFTVSDERLEGQVISPLPLRKREARWVNTLPIYCIGNSTTNSICQHMLRSNAILISGHITIIYRKLSLNSVIKYSRHMYVCNTDYLIASNRIIHKTITFYKGGSPELRTQFAQITFEQGRSKHMILNRACFLFHCIRELLLTVSSHFKFKSGT